MSPRTKYRCSNRNTANGTIIVTNAPAVAYDGWYVTVDDPSLNMTVHCIADDGGDTIVNGSPRVLISTILATTLDVDLAPVREKITACMVEGNCPSE